MGKAPAEIVSIAMPRYSTDLDWERSDFCSFMTIPREWQSERSWLTCCQVLASEEARISQSSRYHSRQTPREWAQAETAAKTLMNTCGVVESPKHRALN